MKTTQPRFLQKLRIRQLLLAVFSLGCFWCLYYVNPHLRKRTVAFLSKLSLWVLSGLTAGVAGLAWHMRDKTADIMGIALLQRFSSPNFIIAFLALSWLFYRLRKVLSIPVDDLVKILGLEVPSPPSTTLLEVSSSGATIHWKPPEQRGSVAKYLVRINGLVAGEVSSQENAVTISDLPSGSCYTIRIVAVNNSNFQASSEPIRIKLAKGNNVDATTSAPAESIDVETSSTTDPSTPHPAPQVVACKAFPDLLSSPPAPAMMTREPSSGPPQSRRGTASSRWSSPVVSSSNANASPQDREKEAEILLDLNNKLEEIRAQILEQEKQDEEEEAEFQRTQAALLEQRDSLRKQLKERDDESKDLNKIVKGLEHANSAAQTKKLQLEKTLQEKLRAREKMQEDIARWDAEVPEMEAEIETLTAQMKDMAKANEDQVQAIRVEQKPDLEILAAIEEQIQERGREVKELEEEKKRLEDEEGSESAESNERTQAMIAEEKQWAERIAVLQTQLNHTMAAYYQAQANFHQMHQQHQRLEMYNNQQQQQQQQQQQRSVQADGFVPGFASDPQSTNMEMPMPPPSQPSPASRVNFDLSDPRLNPPNHQSRNIPSSLASYRASSPFVTSGMTMNLPSRPHDTGELSTNIENLTGGAMTSPSAGDLLPSGLFGDDTEDIAERSRIRNLSHLRADPNRRSRPTSMTSSQFANAFSRGTEGNSAEPGLLPGLGNIPGLAGEQPLAQRSPAGSFASPSNSAVSSPHASLANLHSHKGSDSQADIDRQSIKSAAGGSSGALPASKRFDFFGRQRGKTTGDGPALGSLKNSQSQSMPRDSNDISQPLTSSTRSQSKSAGGLFGQMSNAVLGRKAATTANEAGQGELSGLDRAGSVSSFGSANNPWTRPFVARRGSISRPGSTYSMENALPKPTSDIARFGWGVSKESLHRSGSVHNPSAMNNPWSPFASRRASVQQDPKAGALREIEDAEVEPQEDSSSPPPAPIGTKPRKSKDLTDLSKQLNPNARDFTSMFGFGRKGDKAEKSKKKDKSKSQLADDVASTMTDDSSPPDSRKSRDTMLSSNAESFEDGATDERTDSNPSTPHESTLQASPGGRDTLMRMLSRKGSSGKFSLPSRKDRSSLFSRKTNQTEENEDDSGSSSKMGQSLESITSYPTASLDKKTSGFSLSFKRKSKRADDTPSFSEASMTSETGDEEEQGESTTP